MEFIAGIFFVVSLIGLLVAVIGPISPTLFKDPKTGAIPTRKALFGGGLAAFFVCMLIGGFLDPEAPDEGVKQAAPATAKAKEPEPEPVKQAPPPAVTSAEKKPSGPEYTQPSQESLKAAKELIEALNRAVGVSIEILTNGFELSKVSAHSRYFDELNAKAESRFGSTIFEPIGRCGIAANWARTWWLAQVSTALNGGIESAPGSIKSAYEQFKQDRHECLKNADPVAMAKENAEMDAELKKKFGGGRECLTVYDVDPKTKELVTKPKPAHCRNN